MDEGPPHPIAPPDESTARYLAHTNAVRARLHAALHTLSQAEDYTTQEVLTGMVLFAMEATAMCHYDMGVPPDTVETLVEKLAQQFRAGVLATLTRLEALARREADDHD